jgi:protein-tyrosine phosphatase
VRRSSTPPIIAHPEDSRVIDLHSHILPGLDDGARTLEDSRAIALAAVSEGVTAIAATPHVRGDYPTRAARMEFGVTELRRFLESERIDLAVLHGAEIEIARVFELPPEELQRLTLAHSRRYVLLEMPYRGWPRALPTVLNLLRAQGLRAVIAHPERNPDVQDRPDRMRPVVRDGALVQITSASIDGRLGRAAKDTSHRLLELGLVHLLASDAHGPNVRDVGMARAIAEVGAAALARFLTVDAPAAVVAGEPVPEPPAA